MALTLTRRTQPRYSKEAKRRKRALRASGHSHPDLARVANVSVSMAHKWMNCERTSPKCARAFALLIAQPTNGVA